MSSEQPTTQTPLDRFKNRFTPLYRVLLILGIVAIILALPGVSSITTSIDYLSRDIFYALSGMLAILVALPLMMASLVLLWHKHPAGIRLRLIAYAVSIIATTLSFFASSDTVNTIVKEAVQSAQELSPATEAALLESVAHSSFYAALYVSIAVNLVFAFLWILAWKKQAARDAAKPSQ